MNNELRTNFKKGHYELPRTVRRTLLPMIAMIPNPKLRVVVLDMLTDLGRNFPAHRGQGVYLCREGLAGRLNTTPHYIRLATAELIEMKVLIRTTPAEPLRKRKDGVWGRWASARRTHDGSIRATKTLYNLGTTFARHLSHALSSLLKKAKLAALMLQRKMSEVASATSSAFAPSDRPAVSPECSSPSVIRRDSKDKGASVHTGDAQESPADDHWSRVFRDTIAARAAIQEAG